MMALRKFVTLLLVLALLLVGACTKKKAVLLPPRSLAPTLAVALPDEIPEVEETPVSKEAQIQPEPPPVKSKPKKAPRTTAKKTTPPANTTPPAAQTPSPSASPAPSSNSSTVASLRPPQLPPDTAIAAAVSSENVNKQKADTAHIVDTTENDLKSLSRPLSDEEKSMKVQIQSFLLQSRKATSDGDFERAYNLAMKAQLLAEALVKK